MLTKIDLCSMALLKIGEEPIQSLLDDSAAAKLSRALFDPVMDGLLSMHPWHFACRKFDLVKNTDDDFLLPPEILRVLHCDGNIIGNRIQTPGSQTTVLAITRVSPDCYPCYFVTLAATKLALEFSIPLTGDQTVFRMLTALYESELQTAKFIDSTTSKNPDIANFSLINARF